MQNSSPPYRQTTSVSRAKALEQLGDVPQHLVADAVSVLVVDPLEVVDVDHDAGERVVVALALLHCVSKAAKKLRRFIQPVSGSVVASA
jgi:hypothetical protein